jgi:hypothetical protein
MENMEANKKDTAISCNTWEKLQDQGANNENYGNTL